MTSGETAIAANLAQELLHAILELVKDDRSTLKACGHVNKAWNHASRALLFHSLDLSTTLTRNDWISFFLNVPFGIGGLVRQIVVKNTRQGSEFNPTGTRVLAHFATSVTSLILSDVHVTDFANLASTISKFKQLKSLILKRVSWDCNGIDSSQPLPPHQIFPPIVTSLRLMDINLDHFLAWLLAHSQVPAPSSLSLGPITYRWRLNIAFYLRQVFASMTHLGLFFPEAALDPYYPSYCLFGTSCDASQGHIPLHASLKQVADRFQARHGFSITPLRLDLNGIGLRTFRIHKYISQCRSESGHIARMLWFTRMLLTIRDFSGIVEFEVDVPTVSMLDGLKVDWDILEDILLSEAFKDIEAVMFFATTAISLPGLENILSLRLPKIYSSGLLKVERAENLFN